MRLKLADKVGAPLRGDSEAEGERRGVALDAVPDFFRDEECVSRFEVDDLVGVGRVSRLVALGGRRVLGPRGASQPEVDLLATGEDDEDGFRV